jgi:hypothetical protein
VTVRTRHLHLRGRLAAKRGSAGAADLGPLVYELLDAHADTARLAAEFACDPHWAAHLDYLRALQRAGRALLARTPCPDTSWRQHR